MEVKLVWVTPHAERHLIYMAKISNPTRQHDPAPKLISYLMRKRHWSPFDMVNICFETDRVSRDTSRQMLRHWSIHPQEFSQRYADVRALGEPIYREARMQHPTNRQASVPCEDEALAGWWHMRQRKVWLEAEAAYGEALERGIAKEVARNVLPEGMTPSRLYMNATIRSALFFCTSRTLEEGAQKEIVAVADGLRALVKEHLPQTWEAFMLYMAKGAVA